MFLHRQALQCNATPEKPDAVYTRKLQEVIGGQYGEITVAAVVGGMDVQDAIPAGAGACPVDSKGNPWNAGYVTASGNLLAEFSSNINAEMQVRIAVARLYHQTDDPGVQDLLSFLLARDTHHQNQWLAAALELQEQKIEELPVPSNCPIKKEHREFSHQAINFSDGTSMAEGPWASGPSPDSLGEFTYVDTPMEGVPMPPPLILTPGSTGPL